MQRWSQTEPQGGEEKVLRPHSKGRRTENLYPGQEPICSRWAPGPLPVCWLRSAVPAAPTSPRPRSQILTQQGWGRAQTPAFLKSQEDGGHFSRYVILHTVKRITLSGTPSSQTPASPLTQRHPFPLARERLPSLRRGGKGKRCVPSPNGKRGGRGMSMSTHENPGLAGRTRSPIMSSHFSLLHWMEVNTAVATLRGSLGSPFGGK